MCAMAKVGIPNFVERNCEHYVMTVRVQSKSPIEYVKYENIRGVTFENLAPPAKPLCSGLTRSLR